MERWKDFVASATGRVLLLVCLALMSLMSSVPAFAVSPPSSPAQALYVSDSWDDTVFFNGANRLRAYQIGWNSPTGMPAEYSRIVLDFGRQVWDPSFGWGICLIGTSPCIRKPNSWVKQVAEAFMNGYNDAHSVSSFIAVGTNNSNYNWLCNNSTGSVSADWYNAGVAWAQLINSISAPSRAVKRSANDIESWNGHFSDGWTACGRGAERWFDGYESQASLPNYNFGTNGYVELPSQWTQSQVHAVSYGRTTAYVLPQIYCPGNIPGWVNLRSNFSMYFSGVTSEDAFSTVCGFPSYTWQSSWSQFDTALANAGFPDYVQPSVSSFYWP